MHLTTADKHPSVLGIRQLAWRLYNFWKARNRNTIRLHELDLPGLIKVLETPSDMPLEVHAVRIESSSWCNLKCAGCPRTLAIEEDAWFNKHTSLAEYTRLLEHIPVAQHLDLHDVGEPTLNPELPEIVSHARDTGRFGKIFFITNGMARTPEYFTDLFERGLSHVTVSVDSLTPEIAAKTRFGTKVDKLKAKLDYLIVRHPGRIRVNTVLSSVNLHDIDATFTYLNDLAAKSGERLRLSIALFDDFDGKGLTERKVDHRSGSTLRAIASRWPDKYLHLDLVSPLLDGADEQTATSATTLCRKPWSSVIVDVKGFILPCGRVHDPEAMLTSNLFEQSYEDIMRGPAMIRFLKNYGTKSPDFCKGCLNDMTRNSSAPDAMTSQPTTSVNQGSE